MAGLRKCEDIISSYLELTDNTEPRLSYRMACIISAIASCLQRKVFLPWGDLYFYPNMFIVLVGPPAARKGTAIGPVRDMLDGIGIPMAADESSRQRLVQLLQESSVTDISKQGLQCSHCSMTMHASELTVTLGYNNMSLLTYLNDWFDCRNKFVYSTVARENEEINNVWVNLLGATTPTLLQSAMPQEAVGAGFTSRTFFVYASDKAKVVVKPTSPDGMFEAVQHDLKHLLRHFVGPFQYDKDFDDLYAHWRQTSDNLNMGDFRLNHYVDRRATHFMKLCMIFCASRTDEMVIRGVDFERALTFMEAVEGNMRYVFEGMGANAFADVQARILRLVRQRKSVTEAEVMKMMKNEVMHRDLQNILQTLQKSGEISWSAAGTIKLTKGAAEDARREAGASDIEKGRDSNGGTDSLPGLTDSGAEEGD